MPLGGLISKLAKLGRGGRSAAGGRPNAPRPNSPRGGGGSGGRGGGRGGRNNNRRKRDRDIDIDIDPYGTGVGGYAREFFSELFGVDYRLKNNNPLGLVGDAVGGGARKNMNIGRPAPQFNVTPKTAKRYNNPTLQILSFQISDIIDSMSSINSELRNQLDLTRYNYNQSLQVQRENMLEAGSSATSPHGMMAANDNAVTSNIGITAFADAINRVTDQLLELSESLENLNSGGGSGGGGGGGGGGMDGGGLDIDVDRRGGRRSFRDRLRRMGRGARSVGARAGGALLAGGRIAGPAALAGGAVALGGGLIADSLGRGTTGGAIADTLATAGEYSAYGSLIGTAIGGGIGAFFGGVGALPGAAIGNRLGALAGAALGGGMGLVQNANVLFGTGAQGSATPQLPVNNAAILATIRQKESGGNYNAQNPVSTASGAYQFLDSTWSSLTLQYGIGTQYPKAKLAPPAIQDAVADRYVSQILAENGGDVSKVPLVWFTGNPRGDMDPDALAANRGQTGQQYQQSWLGMYSGQLNMPTGLYAAPAMAGGLYGFVAAPPPVTTRTRQSGDSAEARTTLQNQINSIRSGAGPVEFTARNPGGTRYRARLIPSRANIGGTTVEGNRFVLEMREPGGNWTHANDYGYDRRDNGRVGRAQLMEAVRGSTLQGHIPETPRPARRATGAAAAPRPSGAAVPTPPPTADAATATPAPSGIPKTGPTLEASSREAAEAMDRPIVNVDVAGTSAPSAPPGTTMSPTAPTSIYGMEVVDSPSSSILTDVMHKLKYYPASR